MNVSQEVLTGRTRTHVTAVRGPWLLHEDVVRPFEALRGAGVRAGFDLQVISGFRDFDQQLLIWNAKASEARRRLPGRRDDRRVVSELLRWSALPGASRHHWGTDLDVYDGATLPAGYEVQLIPAEVEHGGVFAPLHDWLDDNAERHGFFRPYAEDRGGVAPERWHLSYAPVAERYFELYDLELLSAVLADAPLALKEVVLADLEPIYERYVRNVAPSSSRVR